LGRDGDADDGSTSGGIDGTIIMSLLSLLLLEAWANLRVFCVCLALVDETDRCSPASRRQGR
jgi:hypothetical protein